MIKNKVFKNASWIIGCRIAQSALSFLVTMLTARFLGPSNFGVINYAASIVAFIAPLAKLGLENIQVQEFVNYPKEEGKIIGTTLAMSLISSAFCVVGVVSFTLVANVGEVETIVVCALYSIILFFQGAELMQYWFQSKYMSKYASIMSLAAFGLVTVYRIILLIMGTSVYLFAIANAIDYIIIFFGLIVFYKKLGGPKMQVSINIARRMFSKSKYYIVSNLMVAIFSQTDRIMLKLMVDDAATGIYSAAVSCACLANFVYVAIIDSYRPLIFENYKLSKDKFERSMSQLYSIIIYISLVQCLFVTLLADPMIKIIYGTEYISAVAPLRVSVWFSTFSFIGSVRNVWILAEGCQKWLWIINLSGALGNVLLNLLLIPLWGIAGASFASLLTQIFSNIIVSYIIPETRHNTFLMIKGLNPKSLVSIIKAYKK